MTLTELGQLLSIGVVLLLLAADTVIYWLLATKKVDMVRPVVARVVKPLIVQYLKLLEVEL